MQKMVSLFALLLLSTACHKDGVGTDTTNVVDSTPPASGKTTWWQPTADVSFDWDLDDISSADTFTGDVVDVERLQQAPKPWPRYTPKEKK